MWQCIQSHGPHYQKKKVILSSNRIKFVHIKLNFILKKNSNKIKHEKCQSCLAEKLKVSYQKIGKEILD